MIDQSLRNLLAGAVARCRRLLVGDWRKHEAGDIGGQLEAPYGFNPRTGRPEPLAKLETRLKPAELATAQLLREWHEHLVSAAPGASEAERVLTAYDQMKYELGYTALHRLAALRMAEERGIVRECVRRGHESEGFRVFLRLMHDHPIPVPDAYASFLARLYDELAIDLPAVFDRRLAASLVSPSPAVLPALLEALNAPGLEPIWGDDETLGWIFEEYNDAEERKEMRKHDAPRNARELAVRNQFFTPRWVVEFLTDNTLGRLWYEQTGGETELVDRCRFLVKPEGAPAPVELRDPRDFAVLDPACGSGHFLLYVFDLLEEIYLEAWRGRRHRSPGRVPLWEEYQDEQAFRREIPRLILANNLHGVDIDPRCVQEAALTLWLRAHRSWQSMKLAPKDRPRLPKLHLVCAQAMPDAPDLRKELVARLRPAVLGRLLDVLFGRAAEMGLLLRAETAFADTVAAVKKDYENWRRRQRVDEQGVLFQELAQPRQTTIADYAELRELGDEAFFQEAEARLELALKGLVEEVGEAEHYRAFLFSEDVRHGLELFEVSRKKFDVILMNPPFGVPTDATEKTLYAMYPECGGDLYAMFIVRGAELLGHGGRIGAITKRTWIGLEGMSALRSMILGNKITVETSADLGFGVLNAKVETAAAVFAEGARPDAPATWIRLVKTSKKAELLESIATARGWPIGLYRVPSRQFADLPECIYAYWMSSSLLAVLRARNTIERHGILAKAGAESGDDKRFLRLAWEVPASVVGLASKWMRISKGGEHRVFWDDVHVVIRAFESSGAQARWRRGDRTWFGSAGVTWQHRTNLRLAGRALPQRTAFGHKGPSAFSPDQCMTLALLALLNSRPAFLLLSVRLGTADDSPRSISKSYEVGLVRSLPWLPMIRSHSDRLTALASEAVEIVRLGQVEEDDTGESTIAFALPPVLVAGLDGAPPQCLEMATRARVAAREERLVRLSAIQSEIDDIVAELYGFSDSDRGVMDEELEPPLAKLIGVDPIDEELFDLAYRTPDALDGERLPGGLDAEVDVRVEFRRKKQVWLRDEATLCRIFQAPPAQIAALRRKLDLLRPEDLRRAAADLVSYAVGVAFGRWDVRLVSSPELVPRFADPFDPLPPCPLGQLVGPDGLPATETRIASMAWLKARKHPLPLPDLPPDQATITAADYPVEVVWSGLLVDDALDSGSGPAGGFLRSVERALDALFHPNRGQWEAQICEALGRERLADWLRAPSGFFADHLARYSKSGRKAPIYWPLTTESGTLTFWIYAPRFGPDTLPLIVNRLRESVELLKDERDTLRSDTSTTLDKRARIARLELLEREIKERQTLHVKISALLARGYAPHPDDGFVVTLAPLHFAFRLPKWRDALRETLAELEKGELDWAHLAMRLRPNEVREKCRTDLSLAIAHGLEDLHEAKDAGKKKKAAPRARKPAKKSEVLPFGKTPQEDDV